MKLPQPRTVATGLVGTSTVLLLLCAAIGFRSSLGYLAFQLAMLLLVIGLGLIFWAGRRGRDGMLQPGPRWHVVMMCAVMAEMGLAMLVLGDSVIGASIIGLAILLAGAGCLFLPRSQKATSPK